MVYINTISTNIILVKVDSGPFYLRLRTVYAHALDKMVVSLGQMFNFL